MSSKFLNVTPRAYIRQKDSVNVLPRIVRTGYQKELGVSSSSYDDGETISFKVADVLAPYMIPTSIVSKSGFTGGSLILNTSIKDSSAYLDKSVRYDQIFPYKEGGNPAAFDDIQDPGFPESQYSGFSSPDSDKSAVVIDLTSESDSDVTKIGRVVSLTDPDGEFYNSQHSGFLYYNKKLKLWNDVGTTDPATGNSILYNPVLSIDNAAVGSSYIINGRDSKFMCQFASSPYSFVTEIPFSPDTVEKARTRGYDKIGEPTSFFGAPYSPRYHARKNNSISLSDYITSPFVVDRISVTIPVRAYRTQNPPYHVVGSSLSDAGFAHDIENYVFFVYLQNRSNAVADSRQDVSSSIRHLIGKKSFCFYNSQTFGILSGALPIHDNGVAVDFNMIPNVASSSNMPIRSFKDEIINLTFRPTTYDNFFGTTSKLPVDDPLSMAGLTGSAHVQHFWRGGQIASGSLGQIINAEMISQTLNQRTTNRPGYPQSLETSVGQRALLGSCWKGSGNFYTTGSGFGTTTVEVSTSTKESVSRNTPIVLFPTDELVFGIESGTNANMKIKDGIIEDSLDQSVLSVTGSRLVIRSGHAQITLYGSAMKERKEVLPVLNQYLGSDAVHEMIHEPGPFDEFDIWDRKILSASYVDGIFTGSMSSSTRARAVLASSGKTRLSGSLQRNIRLLNQDELYYDTFIPESSVIVRGLENSSFGKNNFNESAINLTAVVSNGYVVEDKRQSDVLLARPFTFEKEQGQARQRHVIVSLISTGGFYVERFGGNSARFALYYNGNNPIAKLGTLSKRYTGASSVRYGLLNVRLTNSSAVYRRDRYGQFRDMLEQTRNSKFVTTAKGRDTIGLSAVSALFVSQSSNVQISPSLTQCSNLSFECTSSIPFIDDGRAHNRGILPATYIKLGANNLIFGITGSFGF